MQRQEQQAASPETHWLLRIQAEYREMPGLSLTRGQMQRLWGFDPAACDEIIDALVAAQVLRATRSGSYVSFDSQH